MKFGDYNTTVEASIPRRFADAAARTAGLPTPTLNDLTVLDTAPTVIEGWNGSAWVASAPGGVTSVDGRTGAVTLTDLYVDVAGDTMTGSLTVGGTYGVSMTPGGRLGVAASAVPDVMAWIGAPGAPNNFASSAAVMGLRVQPLNSGTGDIYGMLCQPINGGAGGTVAKLIGGSFGTRLANATGTLTSSQGVVVASPTITAGGVVTTATGIDLDAQKVTGVTTGYGIYQRGTTDYNHFAGNVGLGVTAPTLSRLQFPGSTSAADGIVWGNDINLFRGAANQLRTNNAFKPDGGLVFPAAVGTRITWWEGAAATTGWEAPGWYSDIPPTSRYEWRLNGVRKFAITNTSLDLAQVEAQNLVTHKLAAAPSSPVLGQRYHDTAMKAERFHDGTAWTTIADQAWVGTAAPTGTLNAGDLWWDTDEPAAPVAGEVLSYTERTSSLNVPVNTQDTTLEVITSGTRTYDGSAIWVEFFSACVATGTGTAQLVLVLFDGTTNLGFLSQSIGDVFVYGPVHLKRRLTPTAGSHTYRVTAWALINGGTVSAGTAGTSQFVPAYLQITRA